MSQVLDMFSPDSKDFELFGIKKLSEVLKYDRKDESKFLSGLMLAGDLESAQGVTLYTSGTEITHDKIVRLLRLQENNPKWDLQFKLSRSSELIESFRKEIVTKLKKLTKLRQDLNIYKPILSAISKDIDDRVDELLSDENITLQLYKMKYVSDSSELSGSAKMFNHSISVAIFSYAIAKTRPFADKISFTKADCLILLKTAFFHNIGAVLKVNDILFADRDDRSKLYHEESRKSAALLKGIVTRVEILALIKAVNDYYFDSKSVDNIPNDYSGWVANIILVADLYLQKESGLFGERVKPSLIIDELNVKSVNKELNQDVVDAITLGLGKKNIGDFYKKIDEICTKCKHSGGGHAWPYPFKGFKSPTVFICKDDKTSCEYYEKHMKAVTLVSPLGTLIAGKYSKCLLTSEELQKFYATNKMFLKSQ